MKLLAAKMQAPKQFYPTDVASVVHFWDARYNVVLQDTDRVNYWSSMKSAPILSGAPGSSGKPQFDPDEVNGREGIKSNNGSEYLASFSSSLGYTGDMWWFGILYQSQADVGLLMHATTTGYRAIDLSPGAPWRVNMKQSSNGSSWSTLVANTTVNYDGLHMIACKWAASGSSILRIDGTQVNTGSAATYGFGGDSGQLYIGRGANNLTSNFRVRFFGMAGALSTNEVERLEGYMAWETGAQTTLLPSGHTYRNVRPNQSN